MSRTLLGGFSILVLAFLAACAEVTAPAPTPTAAPDEPVSSDDPTPTPAPEPTASGEFEVGEAIVDSVDVLILESFPVQVSVVVSGNLPDGCTELDETVVERSGSAFTVTLTTRRPVDAMCTQALVSFQQTVPLDVEGLPAGEYTVDVHGQQQTFTLAADNVLPGDETQDAGSGGQPPVGESYGLAAVSDVEVVVSQSAGGAVQAIVRGYLPDPCTSIHRITQQLEGSTVRVMIETRRQSDTMCAQVIQDYQEVITLTALPGPGTYIVSVNGVEAQFTAP